MDRVEHSWTSFEQAYYFWDIITLVCLAVVVLGFMILLMLLLGLPGRIAIARKHPDAEAVYLMGWIGFIAIVPWIQALIWAFKPTDKVDIRNFPEAERAEERDKLEELVAYAYGTKKTEVPNEEIRSEEQKKAE